MLKQKQRYFFELHVVCGCTPQSQPTWNSQTYLCYCISILTFYEWFLLCFNLNVNTCASV